MEIFAALKSAKAIAIGVVILFVISFGTYLYIVAQNRQIQIEQLTAQNAQLENDKKAALEAVSNLQNSLAQSRAELESAQNANRLVSQALSNFDRNLTTSRENLNRSRRNTAAAETARSAINNQVRCLLDASTNGGDVTSCALSQ